MLHFPDANTMKECLEKHPLLTMDYYQEKGITKAIVSLAVERFADSKKVELGIQMGVMTLIYDLQQGVDGFTGNSLPNLGKLGLPPMVWAQISMAAQAALVDCAKKV